MLVLKVYLFSTMHKVGYFLGNMSLCDSITYMGMVIFIQQYYDTFHILCLHESHHHLKAMYSEYSTKIFFTIVEDDNALIQHILIPIYQSDTDVLILGTKYRSLFPSRINDDRKKMWMLEQSSRSSIDANTCLERATSYFDYMRASYNEMGLGLHIYAQFWNMNANVPLTPICHDNYYRIILLHSHSISLNKRISLDILITYYLLEEDTLLLCVDHNVYPSSHPKYEIANKYCALPTICDYYPLLFEVHEIHVIDAEIAAMISPLYLRGNFVDTLVYIYDKDTGCRIPLLEDGE